jgi:hypothetical protein
MERRNFRLRKNPGGIQFILPDELLKGLTWLALLAFKCNLAAK